MNEGRNLRAVLVDDNPPNHRVDQIDVMDDACVQTYEDQIGFLSRSVLVAPDLVLVDLNFCEDKTSPAMPDPLRDPRGLIHGALVAARFQGMYADRPLGVAHYSQQCDFASNDPIALFGLGLLRAQMGFPLVECLSLQTLRQALVDAPMGPAAAYRLAVENFRKSLLAAFNAGNAVPLLSGLDTADSSAKEQAASRSVLANRVFSWIGRDEAVSIKLDSLFFGCQNLEFEVTEFCKAAVKNVSVVTHARWVTCPEGPLVGASATTRDRWLILHAWAQDRAGKEKPDDYCPTVKLYDPSNPGPYTARIINAKAASRTFEHLGLSLAKAIQVLDEHIGKRCPNILSTLDWQVLRAACSMGDKKINPPFYVAEL